MKSLIYNKLQIQSCKSKYSEESYDSGSVIGIEFKIRLEFAKTTEKLQRVV